MTTTLHEAGQVPGDYEWLVSQLRAFSRFYGTHRQLFPTRSDEEVAELIQALQSRGPWIISRDSTGERTGFIAGVVAPHPYNDRLIVLSELFWWVPEQYRGTRAGALLFSEFKRRGMQSADWIVMTLEEKSPVKPEALESRGFRPYERSFLCEVRS